MPIIQYPHTLTATIQTDAYQDDDGNWVEGTTETRTEECRAEPNSAGKMITGADGTQIVFSWMVYLPQGIQIIPNGTSVSITSSPVATGKVLRFSNGQLNTRIWL